MLVRLCIKYKNKRENLDDMIVKARSLDGDERIAQATKIIRQHGGLGGSMRNEFGRTLEPFEMSSYMWEGLLKTIENWSGEYKASTDWRFQTMKLVRKDKKRTFVSAVLVPTKAIGRFKKASAEVDDLDSALGADYDDTETDDIDLNLGIEDFNAWRSVANRAKEKQCARLRANDHMELQIRHFLKGEQIDLLSRL